MSVYPNKSNLDVETGSSAVEVTKRKLKREHKSGEDNNGQATEKKLLYRSIRGLHNATERIERVK